MDHFAGLDVSVRETSVRIVDDTGRIVREVKVALLPGVMLTSIVLPTREQLSAVMKRHDAYGSLSACVASANPITFRAYSITRCWKPPQVPMNGTLFSRANRMPASAPSMLR